MALLTSKKIFGLHWRPKSVFVPITAYRKIIFSTSSTGVRAVPHLCVVRPGAQDILSSGGPLWKSQPFLFVNMVCVKKYVGQVIKTNFGPRWWPKIFFSVKGLLFVIFYRFWVTLQLGGPGAYASCDRP